MISGKKVRIVSFLVAGVAFIGLTVFAILARRNPQDRIFKGQLLSRHLILAYSPGPKTNSNIIKAHRTIAEAGTNCLPLLAEWLRIETPSLSVRIGKRLWAIGLQTTIFPPEDLAVLACRAVIPLGNESTPIAPDLASACTNASERVANAAAQALLMMQLGGRVDTSTETEFQLRESLDAALIVLKGRAALSPNNNAISDRIHTLKGILQRLRTTTSDHLLVMRLKEKSQEEQVRNARILSRRQEAYREVKPVLWKHLESTNARVVENAVICLKNYGGKAGDSIVRIEEVLSHSDEKVRREATNALSRIRALQNQTLQLTGPSGADEQEVDSAQAGGVRFRSCTE